MSSDRYKYHPPPSQPSPLYEDIVTSTVKGEVELQLRDNVAYINYNGQVSSIILASRYNYICIIM